MALGGIGIRSSVKWLRNKDKFLGVNMPLEPVCGGFQGGFFCGVGGALPTNYKRSEILYLVKIRVFRKTLYLVRKGCVFLVVESFQIPSPI